MSSTVCRIYMDNLALDGEINSKVFPLADTSQRDYPINEPIDCTWEMLAENGQRIMLTEIQLYMLRDEQCSRNRIEMYDRTTSEDDRTGVYCAGPVPSYRSESNRVFLRILGSRLSEKPVLQARYTVFKPENTKHGEAPCGPDEFHCDDICLNQALVCNGRRNCPTTGADEEGCKTSTASGGDSAGLPLLAIILAGVGGLIFVVVVIGVCVTCRYRRGRREPKSARKTGSQKRNALELAVSDSNHTANHLAKQNSKSSYYSLPRPSGHATMMQHRGSFSSKVPSEGGDFGDHISESSSYKKFLQLEQNFDDDSSRCPSPYSPGFTTIIEQHPAPPGMTSDAGWNFQQPLESPFMPSLAENLSKLQQYTKFNNSFPQTIPTAMSPQTPGSPTTGMTMEFRYDPTTPVYPSTKFRIKSPDVKYGWGQELVKSPATPTRSLTFKNQDADVAPDLTREIEAT
ncbi:hypothetical protein DPMN_178522 [Dreissena polymorpha]|uniref:CUB domain-containing protein n=1 Tax=Dreissena polymorpha TaxID=45954 RepID=A0A9D4ECZ8_DREPO|nr:hypothetical protein DPMN_178522 [Dreissena polymorpha]